MKHGRPVDKPLEQRKNGISGTSFYGSNNPTQSAPSPKWVCVWLQDWIEFYGSALTIRLISGHMMPAPFCRPIVRKNGPLETKGRYGREVGRMEVWLVTSSHFYCPLLIDLFAVSRWLQEGWRREQPRWDIVRLLHITSVLRVLNPATPSLT